jgi:hypothetical protein
MPTSLGKRLCVSLPFVFPVDAVLVSAKKGPEEASAFARSIAGLRQFCPWLRSFFLLVDEEEFPDIPYAPARLRLVRKRDFSVSPDGLDPVHAAHSVPELSEQFLIVTAGSAPERDMLPSDFFTPNGIPFVFLDATQADAAFPAVPGLFAQTRANAADFLAQRGGVMPPPAENVDYFTSIGRWAYSVGRSVPLFR